MPGTPTAATTMSARRTSAAEVGGARVADRDGRVRLQEQHRGGPAHDLAAADDDRLLARRVDAVRGEELHAAGRRRGDVERRAEVEVAGVDGMEAVDVLVRRDGVRHLRLVDVLRERKLDEDPVDLVVRVQLVDEREHVRLGRVRRQPDVAGVDPRLGRGLVLAARCRRARPGRRRRAPSRARRGRAPRPRARRPRGSASASAFPSISVAATARLYFARRAAMPVSVSDRAGADATPPLPCRVIDRDGAQVVLRVAAIGFVVAWLFVERLREVVPFWLPFVVLLAAEIEFVLRGRLEAPAPVPPSCRAGARGRRPRLRRARGGGRRVPLRAAAHPRRRAAAGGRLVGGRCGRRGRAVRARGPRRPRGHVDVAVARQSAPALSRVSPPRRRSSPGAR